jgi:hypothetical protein
MRDETSADVIDEIRWLHAEMEHAKEYEWPGKLLPGFARMKQQACFSNAQELVLSRKGLRYVEGEAWKAGMYRPVHHAWVIDENDQVIDTTWTNRKQSPRTYRGVVVADRDEIVTHVINTRMNDSPMRYDPYMVCMSDWCVCLNLLGEEE